LRDLSEISFHKSLDSTWHNDHTHIDQLTSEPEGISIHMQAVNNQVLGDAEAPPIFVYSIVNFVMEYLALEYLAF